MAKCARGDFGDRASNMLQPDADCLIQPLTFTRQRVPATSATDDSKFKVTLKAFYLPTDSGLRNVQLTRSGGKI
jgi:hypothetical protein